MAVEARHLNLFPQQIPGSREFVVSGVEGNGNVFGTPMGYGVGAPLSGTTATETVSPMYSDAIAGRFPAKDAAAMKSESGLTCVPISRKRSRETVNTTNSLFSPFPSAIQNQSASNRCGSFTFLGEDISFQIQQQQLEIDRFIAQHTEKVRMEIEERRKKYSRRIAAAVEVNMMNKLKSKDEEIEKMGKLNWALEERVKSLCVENQIWRDLAQTNEATANALRCNLEQVLARVQDAQLQRRRPDAAAADISDDAQSCCGSNFENADPRTLADDCATATNNGCNAPARSRNTSKRNNNSICRSCEKEESCVLLLPCRHLCLCTVCGSSLHTCPVCKSPKTASVHVNLSS